MIWGCARMQGFKHAALPAVREHVIDRGEAI